MMQNILTRLAMLALVGLLASMLLSACGGGSTTAASGSCSIGSSAGCGGSGSVTQPTPPVTLPVTPPVPPSDPAPPDPASTPAAISLLFNAPQLPTASNGSVIITAIVKNASNVALSGTPVEFAVDSGLLSAGQSSTDSQGRAKVTLSTGGDATNRNITVTAKAGKLSTAAALSASGTALTIAGPNRLPPGGAADLPLQLTDSAGQPIANAALSFSARSGSVLNVKDQGAARTDGQGRLTLQLRASSTGQETVFVSALGASASKSITVVGGELQLTPAIGTDSQGAERLAELPVNTCQPLNVADTRPGASQATSVALSTTLGQLYRDYLCQQPLNSPLPANSGHLPTSYLRAGSAGVATVTAIASDGSSAQTRVEFIATLSAAARLTLQAAPATLAARLGPDDAPRSVLSAMVRDGTPANNPVKGATVLFSLLVDPSGGTLQAPASAVTGSDGIATVGYLAGAGDSGRDGVRVQARVLGLSSTAAGPSALSTLTVSKQALSIQLGTGNRLTELSSSVLQQEFTVLVSDSAGQPVPGASITAAAWAPRYRKGEYQWHPPVAATQSAGLWLTAISATCPNEDRLRTGIYHPSEDSNHDGLLQPGLPVTLSGSGATDALGLTVLRLNYPRDRANWLEVELTVRGSVSGTEASARMTTWLAAVSADLTQQYVAPPGLVSPYGRTDCSNSD